MKNPKDKYIKMKLSDVITEHKRLTKILKNPTKSTLQSEYKDQNSELKTYLKK